MAHNEEVRTLVRKYYVFDRLSLEQAAQKAQVSFGTARRWKSQAQAKGDDWDKVRDAHIMAGGEVEGVSQTIIAGFILLYQTTIDELLQNKKLDSKDKVMLLGSLSDSFSKTVASSKRILPGISELACAMRTLELFGSYIQQKRPKLMEEFIEMLEEFGPLLDKEFKK